MKIGDLIRCGNRDVGILLRKLQYETEDESQNWDGEPAWWIQFIDDEGPMWSYEEELTLIKKGN
jgi:hypothetical protein